MIPLDIRSRGVCPGAKVRRFADRRMAFAFDRLPDVRRIVISIADLNGPKGGNDKFCRLIATFGFTSLVVEEVQPTWQEALARAIRRLARNGSRLRRNTRSAIPLKRLGSSSST